MKATGASEAKAAETMMRKTPHPSCPRGLALSSGWKR
eukprot:CAMPEP_0182879898 /NCGR_PEP_ID=MMETSP0034_2-20130328/16255_1 /TAXON_ID=156128 /ORGANISM="Nephroselmis pyriformis, Strain CCMP717" /LENGTH=36 /DNA_ID= /DNA_START= /DNA_END= /DNA_ORIENTATION=